MFIYLFIITGKLIYVYYYIYRYTEVFGENINVFIMVIT